MMPALPPEKQLSGPDRGVAFSGLIRVRKQGNTLRLSGTCGAAGIHRAVCAWRATGDTRILHFARMAIDVQRRVWHELLRPRLRPGRHQRCH